MKWMSLLDDTCRTEISPQPSGFLFYTILYTTDPHDHIAAGMIHFINLLQSRSFFNDFQFLIAFFLMMCYDNHIGGRSVACPLCFSGIVPGFSPADSMSCGLQWFGRTTHAACSGLNALLTQPAAA